MSEVPLRIKKLLIGSTLTWVQASPLIPENVRVSFKTKSVALSSTDLLLKRYKVNQAYVMSHRFTWEVHMEMVYDTPNNKEKSAHIEHNYFNYTGVIWPTFESIQKDVDRIFTLNNLEHQLVPNDNKNKGYYRETKFTLTVIGV